MVLVYNCTAQKSRSWISWETDAAGWSGGDMAESITAVSLSVSFCSVPCALTLAPGWADPTNQLTQHKTNLIKSERSSARLANLVSSARGWESARTSTKEQGGCEWRWVRRRGKREKMTLCCWNGRVQLYYISIALPEVDFAVQLSEYQRVLDDACFFNTSRF